MKTDVEIKELIRLDNFFKLPLLLTTALQLHCGRWCPIVRPTCGSSLTYKKDLFPYKLVVYFRLNLS